ncbi:MAG: dienelactone hydrolase family protein [Moheibacter sp.]
MKHILNIKTSGVELNSAQKALIMIHGRGSNSEDIMGISRYLNLDGFAILAPQATHNTWYPHSFMAPVETNEPWLGSALENIEETVQAAMDAGIKPENIYFFGFSQGACLLLEYISRNAQKYGGAVAIIGGLIGEEINLSNYKGDFEGTQVFIGTSNPDFHVPLEKVFATEKILKEMNADVTLKVYENFGHSINQDEIDWANKIIFK